MKGSMGYQVYRIADGRWGGYGVPAYCDAPGCNEEINRGLAYCCGGEPNGEHGCGLYFCEKHRYLHEFKDGMMVEVCKRCNTHKAPYKRPSKEHPDWIKHLLMDESWKQWREENPEDVLRLQSKVCSGCKKYVPFKNFSKNLVQKDGLNTFCKDCAREYDENRDKDEVREKSRKYFKNNKEKMYKAQAKYLKDNPKIALAHQAVHRAVSSGKLEKQKCGFCGSDKVEAHHFDYDQKIKVLWVCRLHHRQVHQMMDKITAQVEQEAREKIVEVVKNMSPEIKHPHEGIDHFTARVSGFNTARKAIIKSINKEE